MAIGLYIDARQLQKGVKGFERLIKEMPDKVSDVLNASALEVERKAKRAAPADRGFLRQSISSDISRKLQKHIHANAPYAAYVEFGTGKFAAQYVATLPPDYQAFAARFKGRGGGGFKEFVRLLAEWVKRKGLAGTYSTKTRRRTGNRAARQSEDLSVAYAIAIYILRNGIHPHPYMIPALIQQQPKIKKDMVALVNKFKIV